MGSGHKYHEDNFIRQEVTYKVPTPNYGFDFKVKGPIGLERIKAIVTSNSSPLNLASRPVVMLEKEG